MAKMNKIVLFNKQRKYIDAGSATLAVVERNGKKVNIRKPTFDYGVRESFCKPEYNLTEIGVIEDVESYVRQAFQKKTALMFKEGEEFTGKNEETIKYIKIRLSQMEHVSGISWRQLLRQTGYALISRSNYFWVKVRKADASGGRTIGGIQPVAAYFGMSAENVEIKKNKSGKIIKYRQRMPDGRYRDFSPRDVIHFYAYRKDHFLFGTPQIIPVKEDIKVLRRIEENIELLIYQVLFPIFQYKVGTDKKPAGDIRLPDGSVISEVDYVRSQIAIMPSEGGIVTPERHSIEYIGAEGKALRAREYLDYFKTRVLSGLGVSSVDMGEGSTANRATADSLSNAMIDSVKDFQDIIEDTIEKQVIKELLLESTFNFDVYDPDNIVDFKFKEIDIEQQMKKNTNAQVLYNGDILDINETRRIAGYEPVTEDQEELMFSQRVTMKQAEFQAQSAEKLAGAKAANSATNSNAPTNQHGTKTGPQKSLQDFTDSYTLNSFRSIKKDTLNHISREIIDKNWIGTLIDLNKDVLIKKVIDSNTRIFKKGFLELARNHSEEIVLTEKDFSPVEDRLTHSISKYFKTIKGKIGQIIDKMVWEGEKRTHIAERVGEALDSIKYRADFIDKTENIRAYNYGRALALKKMGYKEAKLELNKDCSICSEKSDTINLKQLDIDLIPPYHPNSKGLVGEGVE